jgi:hypothetical protein
VRTRMGKGPKVSNWDDWKHFGLEIRRECLEPRLGRAFASCCRVNLVGGAGGIAALGAVLGPGLRAWPNFGWHGAIYHLQAVSKNRDHHPFGEFRGEERNAGASGFARAGLFGSPPAFDCRATIAPRIRPARSG